MNLLKAKLLKIYEWVYFPFIILLIGMLLIHLCLNLNVRGDDKAFMMVLSKDHLNPVPYIINRYYTWSSRVFIETALIIVVHLPLVWRILDTCLMVLIAVSISKLTPTKNSKEKNWMITGALFMYPFIHMTSAGWVATTVNYIWPLAFGVFSMIPIKKYLTSEKVNWYEFIVYIPALVFAANQEQMCIILLAVYGVFAVYFYYIKKLNWFILVQTIILVLSVTFILTCPGNANRKMKEVHRWFPEFNTIPFHTKVEMGFSSTLFEFIMKPNILFTVFSLLLVLSVMLTQNKKIWTYIAAIPFASTLLFGLFSNVFSVTFPSIAKIKSSMTKFGTGITLTSVTSWVPDLLLLMVLLSVLISLYVIFQDKKYSLIGVFIILLGFGSRMIMALSPTIWASGPRTFIFMYFSFIIASVFLYQVIMNSSHQKYNNISKNTIIFFAVLSFFNMFYTWG